MDRGDEREACLGEVCAKRGIWSLIPVYIVELVDLGKVRLWSTEAAAQWMAVRMQKFWRRLVCMVGIHSVY